VKYERTGNISILLADASAMLCELLKSAFQRRRNFTVAGCAYTLAEIDHTAKESHVDIALVGANLRDGNVRGLQAVDQLRAAKPSIRTIVLLEDTEQSLVVDAFRAGAKGIFSRSRYDFSHLCRCVTKVHAGEIWANSTQFEMVMEALVRRAPLRVVNWNGENLLSQREEDVVRLVSYGLSNREIASELGLSQHTVKNHLFNIFNRLGVSSRVEVVLYAMNNSILSQSNSDQDPPHDPLDSDSGEEAEPPPQRVRQAPLEQ
jgi:DNA-binding NarL/FixJ family response regulator